MANIVINGFGGVTNQEIAINGFGMPPVYPVTFPTTGIMYGGDSFSILNTQLSMSKYVDTFSGTTLDSSKWTSSHSGTGTVSVNNGLLLNIGTGVGSTKVSSVGIFKNFDISVVFEYDVTAEKLYPTNPITHLKISAKIDNNNYFSIEHSWNINTGSSIIVSMVSSGVYSTITSSSVKSSARTLRLVRYNNTVYAYAGSELLVGFNAWRNDNVNLELSSSSISSPVPLSTKVTLFQPRLLVTFADRVAQSVNQISDRIVGSTPAISIPGTVPIYVHDISTSLLVGEFVYFAPLQLTVSEVNANSIVVNNDSQLRDTSSSETGLRL